MKKITILLLSVFTFTFVQAQEVEETTESISVTSATNDYKQSAGDKNLELQFDPGAIFNASNANNVFSNGLGIRFRMFASESFAYRMNLNISYTNSSIVTQDADDAAGNLELLDKNSAFGVSLRPGIEKHFGGTKRLSPYVGVEFIMGYNSSTDKSEFQLGTDIYENETQNGNFNDGFNFGLAAVAGADFYIAKKLYLGVELNYGVNYFLASTTKYSSTAPNTVDTESKVGKSNSLTFQPGAMGIFRIGFLF